MSKHTCTRVAPGSSCCTGCGKPSLPEFVRHWFSCLLQDSLPHPTSASNPVLTCPALPCTVLHLAVLPCAGPVLCRFREDVALRQRMQGIADIVAASGYPTFVALQEVTPRIMQLFAAMPW